MTKSAAGKNSYSSTILCLVTAFVLVKAITPAIAADLPRHFAVGAVLILLPIVVFRQSASFFKTIFLSSENRWGEWFCIAYLFVPVFILVLFFPEQWPQARIAMERWNLSAAGLSAVLLAPVAEEFFFRGWLLNFQRTRVHAEPVTAVNIRNVREWFWLCYLNAIVFWIFHVPITEDFPAVWMQALEKGVVPLSPGPFFLGFVTSALTL
ncbi:MAG: hypothetical protein RL189_823, partial [Pseudomonadota bacterium]